MDVCFGSLMFVTHGQLHSLLFVLFHVCYVIGNVLKKVLERETSVGVCVCVCV